MNSRVPAHGEAFDGTFKRGQHKEMRQALDAALARRDPKEVKASRERSPGHRRNLNYLARLPKHIILKELLRREMAEKEKDDSRERQRRYNLRKRLKRTMAAG